MGFPTLVALAVLADPTPTTTMLAADADTTVYGAPLTLTAQVSDTAGDELAGIVQFFNGTQLLGTRDVAHGSAVVVNTLAPGRHDHLHAMFAPADSDAFASSTSDDLSHDVEQAGSQITAGVGNIEVGSTTIYVTVGPLAPSTLSPTGLAEVFVDSQSLGRLSLDTDGKGSLATGKLDVGKRTIVVDYDGDAGFAASESMQLTLDVPAETFEIAIDPTSAAMQPADDRAFTLTLTPHITRDSLCRFVCKGLPANATCSFEPATTTLAVDPVTVAVHVKLDDQLFPAAGLALSAAACARSRSGAGARSRRRRKLLTALGIFGVLGCGDARPVQTIAVQVVGISENTSHAANLTLEIR